MSRGPGRWQRVILGVLSECDLSSLPVIVYNELGRDGTASEMSAARRAAKRLAQDGVIKAGQMWTTNALGRRDVLLHVARPDCDLERIANAPHADWQVQRTHPPTSDQFVCPQCRRTRRLELRYGATCRQCAAYNIRTAALDSPEWVENGGTKDLCEVGGFIEVGELPALGSRNT